MSVDNGGLGEVIERANRSEAIAGQPSGDRDFASGDPFTAEPTYPADDAVAQLANEMGAVSDDLHVLQPDPVEVGSLREYRQT
ncbi:hypothetical protein AB0M79_09405 [Polymorphospora sp. NPDC051019]|uniref:hypothetical protein n=1 Tax=Polymorphospora sp. NPDC051019 TaxID=3155725 RepID=UPI003448283E